jgi:hypothetical protein
MTRRIMILSTPPHGCVTCRHWQFENHCAAFPLLTETGELGGIPGDFRYADFRHTQPYPGDHGIQFEPKPGYDAEGRKIDA